MIAIGTLLYFGVPCLRIDGARLQIIGRKESGRSLLRLFFVSTWVPRRL